MSNTLRHRYSCDLGQTTLGAADGIVHAFQHEAALVLAEDQQLATFDVELLAQAGRQDHSAIAAIWAR